MLPKFEAVRTTVTVPAELIERSQPFIREGKLPSRNALIVAALEHFLTVLERQDIDRQFEEIADDEDYKTMNQQLSEDFAESDWEALSLNETPGLKGNG